MTIDKNLQITDAAAGSYNGFWGNQGGSSSEVNGNVIYTITSDTAYPMYDSPLLYFGGGTKVDKNLNYSDEGTGFAGHLDQGGLTVLGQKNIIQYRNPRPRQCERR